LFFSHNKHGGKLRQACQNTGEYGKFALFGCIKDRQTDRQIDG